MREDEFQKYLHEMHTWILGQIDPNYDPDKDIHPQPIYRRHEFPEVAEHLMSFREALVEEFLRGQTLEEVINAKGRNVMQKHDDRDSYLAPTPDPEGNRFPDFVTEILRTPPNENNESFAKPTGWKNIEFKYHDPFNNVHWDIDPDYAERNFPTAYNLIKEYWDDCPIASYSYLAPNTVLHRHTGPENRTGEYIRIHIPLIIPPGDLFFEADGEEVHWDNIFAFDNQLVHSAHNLSDGHRLIFLFDVRRSRIGLPPGQMFNKDRQLYGLSKPFVRNKK
jgi:hypothetical protein